MSDLFVIVGADQVGLRLAQLLGESGRYRTILADRDPEALRTADALGFATLALSGSEALAALTRACEGACALVVLRSWWRAIELAQCAWAAGCGYIDTIESPKSAAELRRNRPADASAPLVPGCGLSPGLASALLAEELAHAGRDSDLTLYVGVLPRQAGNRLGYANIWGIDGLLAEYTEDCLTIAAGRVVKVPPLTAPEPLQIAGRAWEAFTTAGAIDDLVEEFDGRVNSLGFKTIRYPGHLDYMRFLLDDLGLSSRRYLLKDLLQTALPQSQDDCVMIHIRHDHGAAASGLRETRQRTLLFQSAGIELAGRRVSASSELTSRHVASVADLLARGKLDGPSVSGAGSILPKLLMESDFLQFDEIAA